MFNLDRLIMSFCNNDSYSNISWAYMYSTAKKKRPH